jgi:beta,beta-carotene 9',10'-dioxygenase
VTDNANVNVAALGGEVVALPEPSLPVRFDPDTLETLGVRDYGKPLSDAQLSTAHPHHDAARRRHYSYVLEYGRRSRYRLFSLDAAGRQEVLATLPVERPAYMHSFGMSERHLVLAEFPLRVDPLRLRFSGEPFIRNYRWRPEQGLLFHVFGRGDGRHVASARAEAAFAFHHVNAFDEADAVVLDLVAYPDARIIDQLYLERLRGGGPIDATGVLTRYRVPLVDGGVVPEPVRLSDAPLELPRINYLARAGRRYAFVYGAGNTVAGNFMDSLVKIEVESGRATTWHEPGCYPGEPVFVAAPDAAGAEDAGVVLSVVLDARAGASFLLALDAHDFAELARARVPHHVPFGFHGDWFPRAAAPADPRAAHG